MTISVGACAMRPDDARSPDVLIDAADRVLYAAKARGRNRVVVARAPSPEAP